MNWKKISLLLLVLIVVDQALKIWIKTHMALDEAIIICPDWFQLRFIENNGAAFGMQTALMNMVADPEMVHYVDDHIVAFYEKALRIFLDATKGKVHAINVTDMQSACLKASSIGLCVDPLFQDLSRAHIDPDTRVYLSWGSKEAWGSCDEWHEDPNSDSYRWNHAIAARIQQCGGYAWAYCQEGGGHSEAYWEQLVPDFMDFLWMR